MGGAACFIAAIGLSVIESCRRRKGSDARIQARASYRHNEQYPPGWRNPANSSITLVSERPSVPVIDSLGKFLYRIPLTLTQQYVREGRVREVPWNGTRAVMATAEHLEYVKSKRPRVGERYSHNHETADNPRGVWTFKKLWESSGRSG